MRILGQLIEDVRDVSSPERGENGIDLLSVLTLAHLRSSSVASASVAPTGGDATVMRPSSGHPQMWARAYSQHHAIGKTLTSRPTREVGRGVAARRSVFEPTGRSARRLNAHR